MSFRLWPAAAAAAALAVSASACTSPVAVHVVKASTVGSCTSGVLFLSPSKVPAGDAVDASATADCTPGRYEVELTVVGMQSGSWNLGSLGSSGGGGLSGTLHIPSRTPPGFGRASLVANFTCPSGNENCSTGAVGTITILPAGGQ